MQPYAHYPLHAVVSFTCTHTVKLFGKWLKEIHRQTMSSHGFYPPAGPRLLIAAPPPACSEVSDGFFFYLQDLEVSTSETQRPLTLESPCGERCDGASFTFLYFTVYCDDLLVLQ